MKRNNNNVVECFDYCDNTFTVRLTSNIVSETFEGCARKHMNNIK